MDPGEPHGQDKTLKKLITCRSLEHILAPLAGEGITTVVLEIGLHVDPKGLRSRLAETIAGLDEERGTILLGYGLCGRATEGLSAGKSTLVLPRVDDCVGALLGSRARHRRILAERAGTYFLERAWLGTEIDLFAQFGERLTRYSPERREKLVRSALKNYTTLALLSEGEEDAARGTMEELAGRFNLSPMLLDKNLGLLTRLVNGPWSEEEFIIVGPGAPVPFF